MAAECVKSRAKGSIGGSSRPDQRADDGRAHPTHVTASIIRNTTNA